MLIRAINVGLTGCLIAGLAALSARQALAQAVSDADFISQLSAAKGALTAQANGIAQWERLREKASGGAVSSRETAGDWVAAVKEAYEKTDYGSGGVPQVPTAQLPENARKQLEQDDKEWGPEYPSKAYKLMVQDRPAFVIENNNDSTASGGFVHIFDAQGRMIASGRVIDGTGFTWDK